MTVIESFYGLTGTFYKMLLFRCNQYDTDISLDNVLYFYHSTVLYQYKVKL
jgi:hypothetical protein